MSWVILTGRQSDLDQVSTPHKIITNRDYLAHPALFRGQRPKVINLSNSYAYQSRGYYASLLASSRGHRVIPTVETMIDLSEKKLYESALPELEQALNKSRKEFETKLQILKMRKGTLATQLAAARSASGDAFGGTSGELFDKFQQAEDRIDAEAIETEVDAALRGEELAAADFDAKLLAAGGDPRGTGTEGDPDAALAAIKAKVEAQKAARQARIAEAQAKALPAAKKDGDAS